VVADVSNRAEAQMNIHKNARTILQSTPDGPPRCCGCEGRDSGSRLLRQRANRAQMGVALAGRRPCGGPPLRSHSLTEGPCLIPETTLVKTRASPAAYGWCTHY